MEQKEIQATCLQRGMSWARAWLHAQVWVVCTRGCVHVGSPGVRRGDLGCWGTGGFRDEGWVTSRRGAGSGTYAAPERVPVAEPSCCCLSQSLAEGADLIPCLN